MVKLAIACVMVSLAAVVWADTPQSETEQGPPAQGAPPPRLSGPKPGFRDWKWGDPPRAGWTLKKRTTYEVYVESHLMDHDKVLGIDYNTLTYFFCEQKFCGIEVEFPPMFADQLYSALQSAWGPPARGNEDQATWSTERDGIVTDATFVRRYAPVTTKRILFGGEPMPTLRIFRRGTGEDTGL